MSTSSSNLYPKRTTFYLDPKIHKELKRQALQEDLSITSIFEALWLYIESDPSKLEEVMELAKALKKRKKQAEKERKSAAQRDHRKKKMP